MVASVGVAAGAGAGPGASGAVAAVFGAPCAFGVPAAFAALAALALLGADAAAVLAIGADDVITDADAAGALDTKLAAGAVAATVGEIGGGRLFARAIASGVNLVGSRMLSP